MLPPGTYCSYCLSLWLFSWFGIFSRACRCDHIISDSPWNSAFPLGFCLDFPLHCHESQDVSTSIPRLLSLLMFWMPTRILTFFTVCTLPDHPQLLSGPLYPGFVSGQHPFLRLNCSPLFLHQDSAWAVSQNPSPARYPLPHPQMLA